MPGYYFEVYDARPATDGGAIDPVKGSKRSGAKSLLFKMNAAAADAAAAVIRTALDDDTYFHRLTITAAVIEDMLDGEDAAFGERIGKGFYGIKAGTGVNTVQATANATFQDLA